MPTPDVAHTLSAPEAFKAWADGGKSVVEAIAALIIAGATAFGVSRYGAAARAEERQLEASRAATEVTIAQQFTTLMQMAEGWGALRPDGTHASVGLASQRAAVHSTVRLVQTHPPLRDSAIRGLGTLSETASMTRMHADFNSALATLNTLPSSLSIASK